MATKGSIYKRCGCRDTLTRRRLEQRGPRLSEPRHGSWAYRCPVRDITGERREVRKGGFSSRTAARRARDEVQAQTGARSARDHWLTEQWLRYWLPP
jgi:hypothetical protein